MLRDGNAHDGHADAFPEIEEAIVAHRTKLVADLIRLTPGTHLEFILSSGSRRIGTKHDFSAGGIGLVDGEVISFSEIISYREIPPRSRGPMI